MTRTQVDLLTLFVWALLLIAVPIAATGLLRKGAQHTFAKLNEYLAVPLCSLIWIHGVIFDTPNNTAVYNDVGIVGFWFQVNLVYRLKAHAGLVFILILPAILFAGLAIRAAPRRANRPASEPRLAMAFACTVLAGLLLHHVPDLLMDVAMHAPYRFAYLGDFIEWPLKEIVAVLIAAAFPAAIALRLTRRAYR